MASAVVQEPTREVPALTLSVNHTSSSSPFPSPGSGFLPPPKLGAHEFASRSSPVEQALRSITAKRRSHEEMNGTNGAPARDGEATPTIPTSVATPVTPTPTTFHPPPQVTIPDPQDASLITPVEKPTQRESLSSSRPAPPSPAVSRRASSTLSRQSSRARSRPQSRVTSLSQQLFLEADHRAEGSSSTLTPSKLANVLHVKIRDFAYPPEDERHVGKGPDAPKRNRPRNRASTYSSSSSSACSDDENDAEEEQKHSSWGAFRWNTLSTHFWGGKDGEDASDEGPSRTDFDRNFEQSSPTDEDADPDDEYYAPPAEDEPLVPGMYRALYAFEPEGTAEMAMEEEQVVHVIGRGGGVGWAIVEKEGGGHALVPESYLELVQPDEPSSRS